ncbi:SAM-dependent methyltransferase [Mycobacterium sp. MS1601]|uniref:SAM-dependent methyltransferase n=1 Tax=Mycobacterium sp. MS1601 TaxID=1936029 RepID=UPI00097952CC|nr:SAM-dependent methyltransferase [Mycobacterium sp. MS1601]AQA01929.1 SAM-dependent methyltransferase [Mycobacterium sp. MS1601]
MRLPDSYFERIYAEADDPFQLSTRWYEQRKYAITLSLLPQPRYRHAFEPGCSIGTFTELLVQRCDHVTAIDVASAALESAAARVASGVSFARGALDDPWPDGPFDLVVLSEVGYYLSAETLAGVLAREVPRLAPGATVLAAHWRHPVEDYPITGDEVHTVLAATPGLMWLGRYCDDDVVIDVYDTADGSSVAAREFL